MTEAAFTAKLVKALKREMPDAIVWRGPYPDAGRPDLQVVVNGTTTYVEAKKEPYEVTKLQRFYLARIGPERAMVVCLHKDKTVSVSFGKFHLMIRYADHDKAFHEVALRCRIR